MSSKLTSYQHNSCKNTQIKIWEPLPLGTDELYKKMAIPIITSRWKMAAFPTKYIAYNLVNYLFCKFRMLLEKFWLDKEIKYDMGFNEIEIY